MICRLKESMRCQGGILRDESPYYCRLPKSGWDRPGDIIGMTGRSWPGDVGTRFALKIGFQVPELPELI